eukprot:6214807-Pleurochrysis_carterae.AAC.2
MGKQHQLLVSIDCFRSKSFHSTELAFAAKGLVQLLKQEHVTQISALATTKVPTVSCIEEDT